MVGSAALREVAVAFIAAVVTVIGFIAAGWMALVVAGFFAAVLVGMDVMLFDRPVQRRSRAGRFCLGAMSAIAIACATTLAFVAGQKIHGDRHEYSFLVSSTSGSMAPVKAAPGLNSGTTDALSPGERVQISCYVDQADGRWFMLTNDDGWLSAVNVFASPHTGMGSPPRCPD